MMVLPWLCRRCGIGVEGATSEATHASSPSSLQGQESEESTFEVTPFVMSFVSDHPAVEDVVNYVSVQLQTPSRLVVLPSRLDD